VIYKKFFLAASFLPVFIGALPKEPWLGDVYESFFDASYTFDFYRRVADGVPGNRHSSNDNQFLFGLGFTPKETWDVYAEFELAQTTRQSFNWRSGALQARYQWLNDIVGDPVTLTTGLSVRGVNHKSIKDISCPYAAEFNLELNLAAGKEWSKEGYWVFRTYGFGALGIAQRGSPWLRFFYSFMTNQEDRHQFELFTRGEFGFGSKHFLPVNHFDGYATIYHQSVDIGADYRYLFDIWGSLKFEYAYRVYAKAYPAGVNYFTIWYNLPFSFF
jgi:hypothetical protein